MNTFSTSTDLTKEAENYILDYISINNVEDTIYLLDTIN